MIQISEFFALFSYQNPKLRIVATKGFEVLGHGCPRIFTDVLGDYSSVTQLFNQAIDININQSSNVSKYFYVFLFYAHVQSV